MKPNHLLFTFASIAILPSYALAQSDFQESRSFDHFSSFDDISLRSRVLTSSDVSILGGDADALVDGGQISASFATGPQFTTNALSNSSEEEDWLWFGEVSIGYENTVMNDAKALFDYAMTGGLGSKRYDTFDGQDGEELTFATKIEPNLGEQAPVGIALVHKSAWYFDAGFDDNGLTLHSLGIELGKPLIDERGTTLGLVLGTGYVFADPDDFERFSYSAKLVLEKELGRDMGLEVITSAAYADYDSFFGADRQNWAFGVGGKVTYSLNDNAQLSAGVSYGRSEDNTPGGLRDFNSLSVTPAIGLSIKGK